MVICSGTWWCEQGSPAWGSSKEFGLRGESSQSTFHSFPRSLPAEKCAGSVLFATVLLRTQQEFHNPLLWAPPPTPEASSTTTCLEKRVCEPLHASMVRWEGCWQGQLPPLWPSLAIFPIEASQAVASSKGQSPAAVAWLVALALFRIFSYRRAGNPVDGIYRKGVSSLPLCRRATKKRGMDRHSPPTAMALALSLSRCRSHRARSKCSCVGSASCLLLCVPQLRGGSWLWHPWLGPSRSRNRSPGFDILILAAWKTTLKNSILNWLIALLICWAHSSRISCLPKSLSNERTFDLESLCLLNIAGWLVGPILLRTGRLWGGRSRWQLRRFLNHI